MLIEHIIALQYLNIKLLTKKDTATFPSDTGHGPDELYLGGKGWFCAENKHQSQKQSGCSDGPDHSYDFLS